MTVIKIVLAVIFALSVIGKLTGLTKSSFENAGLSPGVMYAVALAEVLFTIGLFTPYELISTVVLLAIMGGAIFTLSNHTYKGAHYILPSFTGILLIVLLVLEVGNLIYLS